MAVRAIFLFSAPQWDGLYFNVRVARIDDSAYWLYILDDFPNMVLVTVFSLEVSMWMSVYLEANHRALLARQFVAPGTVVWNILVWTFQIVLWMCYTMLPSDRLVAASTVSTVFHLVAFVTIAACVTFVGLQLLSMVQQSPFSLSDRGNRTSRLRWVIILLALAMVLRSVAILIASSLAAAGANSYERKPGVTEIIVLLLFYGGLEIAPLSVLCGFYTKLPSTTWHIESFDPLVSADPSPNDLSPTSPSSGGAPAAGSTAIPRRTRSQAEVRRILSPNRAIEMPGVAQERTALLRPAIPARRSRSSAFPRQYGAFRDIWKTASARHAAAVAVPERTMSVESSSSSSSSSGGDHRQLMKEKGR